MRCIFCKTNSAKSRSVEHIIPESLGNIEHVLPRGAVCDGCNNYFARKVEGPLLETSWFRHARSRQWIPNKRQRVPPMTGIVPGARLSALVWQDGARLTLKGHNTRDHNLLVEAITAGRANSVIVPIIEAIDQRLMSRFLAKVSLEVLAQRVLNVDGWQDEVVDNVGLDAIRHFARVGVGLVNGRFPAVEFTQRRMYRRKHKALSKYCTNLRSYMSLCRNQGTPICLRSCASSGRSLR